MIVRFSQSGPEKLSPDSKPLDVADWSAAWDAVGTALAKVSADLTPALDKARVLDEQIAALEAQRQAPQPAGGAAHRHRRRQRRRRGARSAVALVSRRRRRLDAALRRRAEDRRSGRAEHDADPPRRHLAIDRRGLERRRADGVDGAGRARRRRRRSAGTAHRLLAAGGQRIVRRPPGGEARRRAADKPALAEAPPAPPTFALDGAAPQPIAAQDAAAQLQASAYTAAFKAAGRVTLASDGSQKSFVLGRVVVQPTLSVKTAPSVDPVAYVEAHFVDSEDAPILPGRVALIRDGAFVGEGRVGFVAPGDGVDLGFGGDDKIKVDRAPVNRKENEPTWYNQTKIETREFVTSVKNLHAIPGQGAGDRSHAGLRKYGDRRRTRARHHPADRQASRRQARRDELDARPQAGRGEGRAPRLSDEVAGRPRGRGRRRAAGDRRRAERAPQSQTWTRGRRQTP